MEISLSDLLDSRDNRQAKQYRLIDSYHLPVLSLTVVMPGNEKRNKKTSLIASKATEAIKDCLGAAIIKESEYDLHTGFEALYVVSTDKEETKKLACSIEDIHPWGRLFDIDVIGEDKIPVSREALGFNSRKCLVCDEPAHDCMRNRKHTLNEILEKIDLIMKR